MMVVCIYFMFVVIYIYWQVDYEQVWMLFVDEFLDCCEMVSVFEKVQGCDWMCCVEYFLVDGNVDVFGVEIEVEYELVSLCVGFRYDWLCWKDW